MPDWQERITRESEPAIRVEHDARYALAAPLVLRSALWCDLGCGHGIAAAQALGEDFTGHAVLVDIEGKMAEAASREISAGQATAHAADLTSPEDLERVRAAILAAGVQGDRCVTCFETVEHLSSFVPLLELLVELATEHAVTVALSVPNDAFFSIENPYHATAWGEGAFEELRRLLPEPHLLLRQVALQGSAIVAAGASGAVEHQVTATVSENGVSTHFLAAFGSRATELAGTALVAQTDLDGQRRWERQRESDLAYFQAATVELSELRALTRERTAQFEEWRRYIHELEDKLGLPRSGEGAKAAVPEPAA